jgi:hypothetical protein
MSTQAVTFIVVFLIILGAYIFLIRAASRRLSLRLPQATFEAIERVIIAGIVAGVVCMFQPWTFYGYRIGFLLVLFSTLAFIVWSHITPAAPQYDERDPGGYHDRSIIS